MLKILVLSQGTRINSSPANSGRRQERGFSLVELLVALAVGLLLIGTSVGFVVSVATANSETLRSTRLTQELRAITEVVARELRRARYVADPVQNVGLGNSAVSPVNQIQILNGGSCIAYGYEYGTDLPAGHPDLNMPQRTISVRAGRVFMNRAAAAPSCDNGGVALSSPEIVISNFQIAGASPLYTITVSGRLAAGLGDGVTRTFAQTVFVRSSTVPLGP